MRAITILFTVFVNLLFGCNNGEKEIIVVPKNFRGYVLIVFDQKNGEPRVYEEGSRVYKIPPSGILKTQFSTNYGWRGVPEYYYDRIIESQKLPSFLEEKKIPNDTIVGFMGSNGNANKDYEGKETVAFAFFYIGTKSEIEHYMAEAGKLDIVKLVE